MTPFFKRRKLRECRTNKKNHGSDALLKGEIKKDSPDYTGDDKDHPDYGNRFSDWDFELDGEDYN